MLKNRPINKCRLSLRESRYFCGAKGDKTGTFFSHSLQHNLRTWIDVHAFRLLLIPIWFAAMTTALASGAETFCVENQVFVDNQRKPRVESTTVFLDDKVYDFLRMPAEVTIFDPTRQRFVLLDPSRRVQTQVSTGQVAKFAERLQQWARTQPDPFLQFLADPTFDENFDAERGELSISSPWTTYRIGVEPARSETASHRYREFSDWYSRLNTMINPGSRPPLARLMVNAALDARQLLPREVTLILRPKSGPLAKKTIVRSEHRVRAGLTETDRQRITEAERFLADFMLLGFEQYEAKIGD